MNFNKWLADNREKLGSEYEVLFASQVLPLVEGLQCNAVTAQYPFVDSDGRNRYCDFTIVESEVVRVAVEIDGYDKRGTGTGMSHEDFLDWQRRQASLASQGWHVLRFANRDVRDEPRRCAQHISRLLNRLRQAQTGRVEIVTITSTYPERVLVPAKVGSAKPEELVSKNNFKFAPVVAVGLLVAFALWQKHSGSSTDGAARPIVAGESISRDSLPRRDVSPEVHPTQAPLVKTFTSSGAGVQVAQSRASPKVNELSYGTLECKDALDWSIAKTRIGQIVTVIGPLLASKPRPDVTGRPMWLDVGNVYPNQNRLTVVVWGENWFKFSERELDAEYWFKTVFKEMGHPSICIKGQVTSYRGVPQIELFDPSQLRIAFRPHYR